MKQRKPDFIRAEMPGWISDKPEEPNPCPVCGADRGYRPSLRLNTVVPHTRCTRCDELAAEIKKQAELAAYRQQIRENINEIIVSCGAPEKYQRMRVEVPTDEELLKSCKKVVDGRSVVLYGQPGRGKFTLAVHLTKEILLTYRYDPKEVRITTVENLCWHIRQGIGDAVDGHDARICAAANTPLLVIDNLAEEKETSNNTNIMREILQTRYDKLLQTIITTRQPSDKLASRYGKDIASRLQAMLLIHLHGEDRRKTEVW